MTTFSPGLRTALQEVGENDTTWGLVANQGVFLLLEDAIRGLSTINLDAGSVVLSANQGATDQARNAILDLTGTSLSSSRTVTIPSVSKLYLVKNSTTGGQAITVRTSGGTGPEIPEGLAIWVWCDGTDTFAVDTGNAATADQATLALDSSALGGIAANLYARLNLGGTNQSFTAAQSTQRRVLTAGGSVSVNSDLSNSFILTPNQNFTLSNPTGGVNGTTIRIVIQQPVGNNYSITWGTAYKFGGGVQPALTATNGAIDYFSFEKVDTDLWVGGGVLDLS